MTPAAGQPRRRGRFAEAERILAPRDPVLAALIAEMGPMRLRRSTLSQFAALVQAIVYQQLAGAAARAIHGRLIAALDGEVPPEPLLALSDRTLRTVGLSAAKVFSLRDLATKVLDGTVLLSPRGLSRQSDDEIIARLSRRCAASVLWSAEMFLIFRLRCLDVWPVGDHGVRQGEGLAWKIPTPTPRELRRLGDPFRPYRTVLTWYCWRATARYAGVDDSALTR